MPETYYVPGPHFPSLMAAFVVSFTIHGSLKEALLCTFPSGENEV